ncbi:glycosyltransferase family 2 protein [Actinomycetospora cinnamomea]|nr:glycosyltransferase [Actinomycetospora cinnamomea]
MPTLSVVVPATDRPATLPRAVAAIERAGADEVVVVDGRDDGEHAHRLPVCAARNLGARRAAGDVVVFVDADVEIHADALRRIGERFRARPELTAVFGSYDDSPSAGGTVAAFRNLLHHHVHHQAGGPAETFWSGLGAVRRDAFLAVGGFDGDRFPHPSVEDVDLGARLVAAGARIELDPAIQGTHLKAWTLRTMVATDFARRGVPWVALLLRSGQLRAGRASTALNLGWRHRLSALACTLAVSALAARRPRVAAGAVGVLVGLNRDFYALLARRRGAREAVVGVGLHAVHHLTAVASVPAGVVVHLRDRRRSQRERAAEGAR